ncbi:hypothetical protein ACFQX6_67200 [Streptosporangium lutulentum]
MKRLLAVLTALLAAAASLVGGAMPARAAVLDGTCIASITLHFAPPATQPIPRIRAPPRPRPGQARSPPASCPAAEPPPAPSATF